MSASHRVLDDPNDPNEILPVLALHPLAPSPPSQPLKHLPAGGCQPISDAGRLGLSAWAGSVGGFTCKAGSGAPTAAELSAGVGMLGGGGSSERCSFPALDLGSCCRGTIAEGMAAAGRRSWHHRRSRGTKRRAPLRCLSSTYATRRMPAWQEQSMCDQFQAALIRAAREGGGTVGSSDM